MAIHCYFCGDVHVRLTVLGRIRRTGILYYDECMSESYLGTPSAEEHDEQACEIQEQGERLSRESARKLLDSCMQSPHGYFCFLNVLPRNENITADAESSWAVGLRAAIDGLCALPELDQHNGNWSDPAMEHYQEYGELIGAIIQNPQMLHPKHYLEIICDTLANPIARDRVSYRLFEGMNYALRMFSHDPRYPEAIREQLNFVDPQSFSHTAYMLEFLSSLYAMGGDADNYGDGEYIFSVVREQLQDAVDSNKGSYLLHERAALLLDSINGVRSELQGDLSLRHIARGAIGIVDRKGVRIFPETSQAEVKKIYEELEGIKSQFSQGGLSERMRINARRNELTQALQEIPSRMLNSEDVSVPGRLADERAFRDWEYLTTHAMRTTIKEDFGVECDELTLREQFAFLDYLKAVPVEDASQLKAFTFRYGTSALRIFLSVGDDQALRQRVQSFAESSDEALVKEVFSGYGKLVEHIDDAGDYLKQNFGEGSASHANAVVEQLLTRARKLLEEAVEVNDESKEAFLEKVRMVDEDVALFTSACRTLKKSGALKLEDVEGVSISEKPAGALSAEEKAKLLSLQDQAYRSLYTPEFLASLREVLKTTLENPHTHFYFLRKSEGEEDAIVSTLRFDEKDPVANTKHLASFFTDPSYNGGAIGEALLDEALMREQADGSAIVLECSPHLLEFYMKHGFNETGRFEFKGESGISMRKDPVMQPYTKPSDEETFAEQKTA